jgi:hypothetical protein
VSLTWRSASGATWVLDGSQGVKTVNEDEGIFTIPTDLVIDQRVGDGGALVSARRSPRRVLLSMMFDDAGEGNGALLVLWRSFFRALAAGGELDYDGPSGTRTLRSVVLEGPDRSLTGHDIQFNGVDVFTVTLVALDPWWYGSLTSLDGSHASAGQAFGDPTAWNAAIPWNESIPWNGGASATIVNDGDVASWCTVVVHNGTATGASVAFSINGMGGWESAAMPPAPTFLSVSGEPGRRGPHLGSHGLISGSDGPIRWNLLTEQSQLFDLPRGESSIVFGLANPAGDDSESWNVFWRPRYLTP